MNELEREIDQEVTDLRESLLYEIDQNDSSRKVEKKASFELSEEIKGRIKIKVDRIMQQNEETIRSLKIRLAKDIMSTAFQGQW